MSRTVVLTAVLLVLLGSVVFPVAGQSSDAPHPSKDATVLYVHNEDGSDEYEGWMNTLPDDGDDIAMGTAEGCTVPIPIEPVNSPLDLTWSLTLDPGLTKAVTLAPGGMINVIVHLGAGGGDGDDLEVSTEIKSGDQTVAKGEAKTYSYTEAGDDPYDTIEWELEPELHELTPGEDLVWQIHLTGDPCSVTSGPFISASQDRGYSRLELPATNVFFPPPIEEVIEEAEPEIVIDSDGPTTAVHSYAWEATQQDYVMNVTSDVVSGTATIALQDGEGSNAFNLTVGKGPNETAERVQIEPGPWEIEVVLEGFEGNLTILLSQATATGESSAPDGEETGETDSSNPENIDGNQTGKLGDEEAGIPAPGMALGVLTLFALGRLLRLRRKD